MVSPPRMCAWGLEVLARLSAGESVTVEVDLQRRDGSSFPALLNAAPSLDDDGVVALIFTAVDLTARRESAASEAFLRQRLQSLWTIASTVDAELTELYDRVMQELLTMTGAQFAFFGILDAAEHAVTVVAFSEGVLELCGVEFATPVFPTEGAVVWGEAIERRASVVVNAPEAIGATLAPGHAPVHNLLAQLVLASAKILTGSEQGYVSTIDLETGDNVGRTLTAMMEGGATQARRETPPPPRAAQVLVVDDERMILSFYARALPRLGYEVTTCSSGSEALAAVQAHPERFDVVVTDQTMPYMTGLELGQRLRELQPNLPLVLCTGLGESMIADDADALGFTAFLEKPIDAQRVSSVLERVIKR